MSRSDHEFAADILDAADQLQQIAKLGRESFNDNWILSRAAERLLEIIGVAAGNLSEEFLRSVPGLPVREARDMRNVMSHEYFRTDSDIVWRVITEEIPALVEMLRTTVPASTCPSDADASLPAIESLAARLPPLEAPDPSAPPGE